MTFRRMAWAPLVVACAISIAYIFIFGADWEFTIKNGTVPSTVFTCLLLSAWASLPYLILLPIGRREGQLLLTTLAVLVILAFGMISMEHGRHTPGDEGGSYIVVPFEQLMIAAAILFGWWGIRRLVRKGRP